MGGGASDRSSAQRCERSILGIGRSVEMNEKIGNVPVNLGESERGAVLDRCGRHGPVAVLDAADADRRG